jgi:hypothetical protein
MVMQQASPRACGDSSTWTELGVKRVTAIVDGILEEICGKWPSHFSRFRNCPSKESHFNKSRMHDLLPPCRFPLT